MYRSFKVLQGQVGNIRKAANLKEQFHQDGKISWGTNRKVSYIGLGDATSQQMKLDCRYVITNQMNFERIILILHNFFIFYGSYLLFSSNERFAVL